MTKHYLIAQSGGPTAAINASLVGIIKGIKENIKDYKIIGAIHGIQGVLRSEYTDLTLLTNTALEKISITPAMILGSCRFKLPDYNVDSTNYSTIFKELSKNNIDTFFYIGGNDSMDTVDKLSKYAQSINSPIKIVGVPKTIDNDLLFTDHTPGFGSAAKYIANTIQEIYYDTYIYDLKSVTIVEIMGRDAGWLTAASVLARKPKIPAPHLIYLPEIPFDEEKFILDIQEQIKKYDNIVVAVSEGIRDKSGNLYCSTNAYNDKFGHAQLGGVGKKLEYLVKATLGIKVRSIELNILQRCAGHIAAYTDLKEAIDLGRNAVIHSNEGNTGFMPIIVRHHSDEYLYTIKFVDVKDVANKIKSVPIDWISSDKNDVTGEMVNYLLPLVDGEIILQYSNGIAEYYQPLF